MVCSVTVALFRVLSTFHAVVVEKSQRSVYQWKHRVADPSEGVERFCWALQAAHRDGTRQRNRRLTSVAIVDCVWDVCRREWIEAVRELGGGGCVLRKVEAACLEVQRCGRPQSRALAIT